MTSPLSILLSGGGLALVRLLTGLVRSKWIASFFGLEGVGLMSQATQFQLTAGAVASLCINAAMIQGAKGSHKEKQVELFQCALFMMIVGTVALIAGMLIFGFSNASLWLFGPSRSASDFAWVLLAVPFTVAASGFAETVFFVRDRFDRYAITSALLAITQPIIFIGLSMAFGIKGMFIAFPVSSIVLAILFYGDLARLRLLDRRWFKPKWNYELARYLATHGVSLFAIGVGGGFLVLSVRSSMLQRLGAPSIGMLQVPLALSAYGGAFITNFLWGRIHPRFASAEGRDSFELSFAIFASFLVPLGIWLLAPLMIPLIYTRDFLVTIPLVGIQCSGDVLYFTFSSLSIAMLAMGQTRSYLFGWFLYYFPFAVLLLFPSLHSVRHFLFVHGGGAALATAGMLVLGSLTDKYARKACIRLAILGLGLFLLMASAAWLEPNSIWNRGAIFLAAGTLGLLLWRALYGKGVRKQLMEVKTWLKLPS